MTDFDALKAPFPPEAVSWRAQTVTQKGDKALALAYIDARDVMNRLDAVCGPCNWQDSYSETPKGRIICTIKIRFGQDWISKSDGAGETDVEGDKGALSDALKRAAVKWGIGRYLYDIDSPWVPCECFEEKRNGKFVWKKWTENPWNHVKAPAAQRAPQKLSQAEKAKGAVDQTKGAMDTSSTLKELLKHMWRSTSPQDLQAWYNKNAVMIDELTEDEREKLRGEYRECGAALDKAALVTAG